MKNYDFHIALSGGMISFLQQRIVNVVVMAWSHSMQKEERAHGAFDLQHFGAAALGCRRMECQSGGRETGRVGAFLTHSTSNGQDQNLHSYVILKCYRNTVLEVCMIFSHPITEQWTTSRNKLKIRDFENGTKQSSGS